MLVNQVEPDVTTILLTGSSDIAVLEVITIPVTAIGGRSLDNITDFLPLLAEFLNRPVD